MTHRFERAISGRAYHSPGMDVQARTTASFTTAIGRLYVILFRVTARTRWTTIRVNVATGELGKFVRLAVYTVTPAMRPGRVIVQGDDLDVGAPGVASSTIVLATAPGLVYLGVATDSGNVVITGLNNQDLRRLAHDTIATDSYTHIRYNPGWTAGTTLTDHPTTNETFLTTNAPMIQLVAE